MLTYTCSVKPDFLKTDFTPLLLCSRTFKGHHLPDPSFTSLAFLMISFLLMPVLVPSYQLLVLPTQVPQCPFPHLHACDALLCGPPQGSHLLLYFSWSSFKDTVKCEICHFPLVIYSHGMRYQFPSHPHNPGGKDGYLLGEQRCTAELEY